VGNLYLKILVKGVVTLGGGGGGVVNTMPRPLSATGQGPGTHCSVAEWVPGATLKGVKITEFLALPGFEPRTVLSIAIHHTDTPRCVCVCNYFSIMVQ